ncbi:MAG: ABC transporter permease [Pirellulales bacterium]
MAEDSSFIMTLGMLEIARGQTRTITNSQTVYIGRPIEWFGNPIAGLGVSPAFLAAIAAVLAAQLLLTRTVYGRYCIAIGTNAEVVRMSGIRTWPYAISVFSISGFCCALAAWAQLGRMPTTDPNAAVGMELSAIAACVIGGTSLMGGRASIVGTLLGVLTIQILQTGVLAQLSVRDEKLKQIITGLVIVLAVTCSAISSRRANRSWVQFALKSAGLPEDSRPLSP